MYFLLKIVSYLLQLIPRKVALFFGRQLGSFIYYFIPFRKSIATKNLEIAFPDWDCNKKKQTLHACYRHFGMVFIDFFRLPKIFDTIDKSIVSINENSLRLFKQNFGGIMLSAHFGNWEFLGPTLGVNNINLVGVTQIQHNNGSNLFFNELRSSKNVKMLPVNCGSKVMIKVIKEGKYLGLISDQSAGERGTKAIFFNKEVSLPKGAGIFHLKTNTPILLGFCILSDDFRYNLSFHELDVNGLSEDRGLAIQQINQRYSNLLEEKVRIYPQQYFWFHRKWAKNIYNGLSHTF